MRFALDTPNFGDYSDPRLLAELARGGRKSGMGWLLPLGL